MDKKKKSICFIVVLCCLVGINIILACIFFCCVDNLNPLDLLLIITYAIFLAGIVLLFLLIKRVFHWVYQKMYKAAENAAKVSQAYPVGEKEAYRTLKVVLIALFVFELILQIINLTLI